MTIDLTLTIARPQPRFTTSAEGEELHDGTLLVNRTGLVAVLAEGNLLLEDGRGFALAGREAAWSVVEDAELADYPALQTRCAELQARRAAERAAADEARATLWDNTAEGKAEAAQLWADCAQLLRAARALRLR